MTDVDLIEKLEQFLNKLPSGEVKVEVIKRYIRFLLSEQKMCRRAAEKKCGNQSK